MKISIARFPELRLNSVWLFTTGISHHHPVNFDDSVDFPLGRERERGKEKEAL